MANRQDLAAYVADECELTKKDSNTVINAVIDGIKHLIAEDGELQISGFGSYKVSHREARQGINPRTQEKIPIPAVNVVGFKPGQNLKDVVNPKRKKASATKGKAKKGKKKGRR